MQQQAAQMDEGQQAAANAAGKLTQPDLHRLGVLLCY